MPSLGLSLSILCLSAFPLVAWAASGEDAIQAYAERKYPLAVQLFEENYNSTVNDARSAYFYALSLTASGQTERGIKVCEDILRRYPGSLAAKQAKVAIARWSQKAPLVDDSLGIVGFKFVLEPKKAPRIDTVFPETPASKAGLVRDDRILAVDDVSTTNLDKEQIFQLLVGKPNTSVTIRIHRGNETKTKALTRVSAADYAKFHPEIWKLYLETK